MRILYSENKMYYLYFEFSVFVGVYLFGNNLDEKDQRRHIDLCDVNIYTVKFIFNVIAKGDCLLNLKGIQLNNDKCIRKQSIN